MTKEWYVFYTKSRHEKKVEAQLRKRGYDVFLPTQKVLKQWSDRKKKVEVPLFNSYIFVHELESGITDILQVPGISWAIRHNGRPAILHPRELQTIRQFLATGLLIQVDERPDVRLLDDVEVVDGVLKGMVGRVVATADETRFAVLLETLGQSILVRIDPILLQKRR